MVELSTPTIQTLVIAATSAVVGCVYFTWKPWMVYSVLEDQLILLLKVVIIM